MYAVSGGRFYMSWFNPERPRRQILSTIGGISVLGVVPASALGEEEDETLTRNGQEREGTHLVTEQLSNNLSDSISTDEFSATITETVYRGVTEQGVSFTQQLQEFPREDDEFVILSTGDASEAPNDPNFFASTAFTNGRSIDGYSPDGFDANSLVDLEITFVVPEDAEAIAFDYQFGTVESPEFLGSEFQDFFEAQLFDPDGNVENIALINGEPVTVDTADTVANTPGGTSANPEPPLPEPPDVAYNSVTELQEVERGVAQFQGEEMTLRFRVGDATDAIYDSAVFLDNLRFVGDVDIDPGFERAEQAFEEAENAYNELLDSYIRSEAHFTAILYDEFGDDFFDILVDYWGVKAGALPDDTLDNETREALDTVTESHNEGNDVQFTQARGSSLYTLYNELADALDETMSLQTTKETTYNYFVGDGADQTDFLDFGNGDSFKHVLDEDFGITDELLSALESNDPSPAQVDAVVDRFEDLAVQYRNRAVDTVRSKEIHAEQLAAYNGEDPLEIHLQQTAGELDAQVEGEIEPNIGATGLAIGVVTLAGVFAAGGAVGYLTTRCTGSYGAAEAIDGVEATGVSVDGPLRWGTQQVASVSNMLTAVGTYLPDPDNESVETQGLSFASGFLSGASLAGAELKLDYLELTLEAALTQQAAATATLDMSSAEEQKSGGLLGGIAERICDAPVIGWFCSYERPSVLVSEGQLTIENNGPINWTPKLSTDYKLFSGEKEFPTGYGITIQGDTDKTFFTGDSETYDVTARAPTGEGLTSGRIDIDVGVNPAGEQFPSGWTDLIPIGLCEADYYALNEASAASIFGLNNAVTTETVTSDSAPEGSSVENSISISKEEKRTFIELTYPNQSHYANLQVRDAAGNLTGFDPTQLEGEPQEAEEIPNSEYSGVDTGDIDREWVRVLDPTDDSLDIEVVVPEVGTLDGDTIDGEQQPTDLLNVEFEVNSTTVPELDAELSTSDDISVAGIAPGEEVTAVVSISETNGDNPLGTVTCSVTEFTNGAGEAFDAALEETEFTIGAGESRTIDVTGTLPEDPIDSTFTTKVTVDAENAGSNSVDIRIVEQTGDSPSISDYTNENGIVDSSGLQNAFADWQAGEIDSGTLQDAFSAWQSGDPVE